MDRVSRGEEGGGVKVSIIRFNVADLLYYSFLSGVFDDVS
jgi:hypothetical protein